MIALVAFAHQRVDFLLPVCGEGLAEDFVFHKDQIPDSLQRFFRGNVIPHPITKSVSGKFEKIGMISVHGIFASSHGAPDVVAEKGTVPNHPGVPIDAGDAFFRAVHPGVDAEHGRLQIPDELGKGLHENLFPEFFVLMVPGTVIAGPDFKEKIL